MEFTEKQRLELGSLSSEFNILVLISTFTAALIISFLSFAQSVINDTTGRNSTPFQFGMFFHVISIGFHLFAALVAARASMICFRISKSLDIHLATVGTPGSQTIEEYPINNLDRLELPIHSSYDGQLHTSDFQRFLVLCEQLQLIGTTIYFPSALFLIFYMFERIEFAIVIYGLTGIGAWAVYRLGFWKVSVLWHDMSHGFSRCKKVVLGMGKSK